MIWGREHSKEDGSPERHHSRSEEASHGTDDTNTHFTNKWFISSIYEELLRVNKEKTDNSIEKDAKDFNTYFTTENTCIKYVSGQ